MSFFRTFFVFMLVFSLASCAEISSLTNPGSSTSVSEVSESNEPSQEDVLNQFSDVAFPPETYLDLTKSVVVGSDENSPGDDKSIFAIDESPGVAQSHQVDFMEHALRTDAGFHCALHFPYVRILGRHIRSIESGVKDRHRNTASLEFIGT